jgi:hypothetical protein
MRREFIQVIAVFAIAVGAGLFAFGRHLDPPLDSTNPVVIERAMSMDQDTRLFASFASGAGVCLMTFGALSIVLPWVNDAASRWRPGADQRTV